MPIVIQVVVVLLVCGIAWYFLKPYVAEPFVTIITVIVVLAVCLWLLAAVGLIPFGLWPR